MGVKRWHTTTLDDSSFGADGTVVPYGSADWQTGDTILRTLVSVAIQTVQLAIPSTHGLLFPPVGVAIGYDTFSDHNFENFTPITEPDYDWMYTEVFPWHVAIDSHNSPPDIYFTAGTTQMRDVHSQRQIGSENHRPFVVAYVTDPTPATIDIISIPVTIQIRTLVDLKS